MDAYIAPGRAKHAGEGEGGTVPRVSHAQKRSSQRALHPLQKAAARAGVGTDQAGARPFHLLFGRVEKVANEWGLVCLSHNILKPRPGGPVPCRTRNR